MIVMNFLIFKNFALLVSFAYIISIPLSYLLMKKWSEGFAYRISIGILEFIIAALITLIVILISVGYKSLRTSAQNSVNSLLYEYFSANKLLECFSFAREI